MRTFSLVLLLLFTYTQLDAQAGGIQGTISSADERLAFASVMLKGEKISKGVTADENGYFQFTDLSSGDYKVTVVAMGYRRATKYVSIFSGKTVQLDFDLQEDRLNLDQVVVSATRNSVNRQDAPVVVNVLGSKLFNATQSLSLAEGLNFSTGVRVENNCQNCGFTQVRLNGLEGSYTQVLVNSRPVFSALNSVYGLEQIPANIIDRVEVVRSGGSALYGSNAIAGTVNIITKDPILNSWEIGSNFALINGNTPDRLLNFNTSMVADDLQSGVTFFGMFRDREEFDANDDGFTEITTLVNNTLGAKAYWKPTELSRLSVDLTTITEYRRGGDRLNLAPHLTDITEELDHTTFLGGINYDIQNQDLSNRLSVYASTQYTNRDSYYGGLGGGRTRQDSLLALNAYGNTKDLAIVGGIQFTRKFKNEDVLTVGTEYNVSDIEDNIEGYNRLIDQQVNTLGSYVQYEWKPVEKFTALLGTRFDYINVDGRYEIGGIDRNASADQGVLSPRVTFMYDVNKDVRLRAGYARGFRAPQAFNEDLHISSVGGEPQFVILSEDLETEFSNAYTASLNYSKNFKKVQTNFLLEGFFTELQNPFTLVSTGAVLENGSILEEVRNGSGANVYGANFEIGVSPNEKWQFQLGGTLQRSEYEETQILFESDGSFQGETDVVTDEFVRNPNFYGYFNTSWTPGKEFNVALTGTYTGSMIVPRVISESGFLDLVDADPFLDLNIKMEYHVDFSEDIHATFSGGVRNVFNSFQDDFDTGPERDSDYIYGPALPRTFFIGVKFGKLH
ncbi:TonB-dependent receptor [Ascidiimonas aurantiaca]|uniref:TonB-dependent receptor n=1 Tax=Ascidiimonas aurantiaca TaxID=1685432 RepID=UPI0030EC53C9